MSILWRAPSILWMPCWCLPADWMLALIIHWNVDLEQARERVDLNLGQEVTQDQEVRDNMSETQEQGGLYEKMGTVYKDPVTGRLFMLTEQ